MAVEILSTGDIDVLGRMPWTSNATFLVDITHPDTGDEPVLQGVYKPRRGERPLHDFPTGLYRREAAAWELAHQLGWGLVPPTIVRDGPFGEGSVQLYVPCDYEQHYFTLRDDPERSDDLRRLAAFDLVANNTDRKAGHIIEGLDGKLWGIDQGLTFHAETKIRTVIWDFCGELIPEQHLESLRNFCQQLVDPTGRVQELLNLLSPEEIVGLHARLEWVLREKSYPGLPGRRRR